MTKAAKRRRIAVIIQELSLLSRNGWNAARQTDYLPLERELAFLRGLGA